MRGQLHADHGPEAPWPVTSAWLQSRRVRRLLLLATLAALAAWLLPATASTAEASLAAEPRVALSVPATVQDVGVYTYDSGPQRSPRATDSMGAGASASELAAAAVARSGPAPASGVAAEETTTVGRWMSPQELREMQSTGRVVEGGGGRTYVTRPSDPDAYPAGKGVFAQFDVPSSSVFPAGKPEWGVIPGPSAGTSRYGLCGPPFFVPSRVRVKRTRSSTTPLRGGPVRRRQVPGRVLRSAGWARMRA